MAKPRMLGMADRKAYAAIRKNERILTRGQKTALYGQVKCGQSAEAMRGLKKLGGVV